MALLGHKFHPEIEFPDTRKLETCTKVAWGKRSASLIDSHQRKWKKILFAYSGYREPYGSHVGNLKPLVEESPPRIYCCEATD